MTKIYERDGVIMVSKKENMPDVEILMFIDNGSLSFVRNILSKLFMRNKTGVLIMRPTEFISKTEFRKRYPTFKKDAHYLDPNRNVVEEGRR